MTIAFFEGSKPRERKAKRDEYAGAVFAGEFGVYRDSIEQRRRANPPLAPFHWEIEFPEVFDRDNRGFDAFIGNPPFQGGRNVTATQGSAYSAWLCVLHEETSGGADLVAHFFRQAFHLVRKQGVLGLIATNTIAQGDTRASGLRWICKHGGEIFSVRRRIRWPGTAAVVVSVVHVGKGNLSNHKQIDSRDVARITAFLFHHGGHDDPVRLSVNCHKSFQGSILLGMGFTFDNNDKTGTASSLTEMRQIIEANARSREVIFPYIGGYELNTSPTHAHNRYVIDFGERSEIDCRRAWPELMDVVEQKVKPERDTKDGEKYPRMVREWWKHWNARPELRAAVVGSARVLAISRVSNSFAFTFLPTGMVYNEKIIVFPTAGMAVFGVLQSRLHETWARFFSSTLKEDLQYTPSRCFETFPFPRRWESMEAIEARGREYYEYRMRLLLQRQEGLTATYNRFHDRDEVDPETNRLRELHAAMDRAVLDGYGWADIPSTCDFLGEHGFQLARLRLRPTRHVGLGVC